MRRCRRHYLGDLNFYQNCKSRIGQNLRVLSGVDGNAMLVRDIEGMAGSCVMRKHVSHTEAKTEALIVLVEHAWSQGGQHFPRFQM